MKHVLDKGEYVYEASDGQRFLHHLDCLRHEASDFSEFDVETAQIMVAGGLSFDDAIHAVRRLRHYRDCAARIAATPAKEQPCYGCRLDCPYCEDEG